MSHKIYATSIWSALGYLLYKLLLFIGNYQYDYGKTFNVAILLALLLMIAYLSVEKNIRENLDYISIVKNTFRSLSLFSLLIGLITYAYYQWIDIHFFRNELLDRLAYLYENGITDKKELVRRYKQMQYFLNPYAHAFLTFITLWIGSFFYSVILSWLLKVVRKQLM